MPTVTRRPTNPPIEHAEFEFMEKEGSRIRVRVIQYQHPKIGISDPMLDIREYLENKMNLDKTVYTGWSKTGISMKLKEVKKLDELLPAIIEKLEELQDR